jgi:ABC-type antimicrobial peptide transport system permease subunit
MGGPYFAVRTDADPAAVAQAVRDVVRQIDRDATVDNVATMEEIVSNAVAQPRFFTVLLGTLAVVAVVLSLAGIYGVISYLVSQRTQEIGIRMALGAQSAQVLRLVLRQGAAVTAIGLVLGLAGAAAGAHYLEGLLFGVEPLDPVTFALAALVFAAVATAASLIPARRATRLQPVSALRAE